MNHHGKNLPNICVPLTGENEAEILAQLDIIVPEKPDIIEWRADFFSELANKEAVDSLLTKLSERTTIPLLFTIRSKKEGGEAIHLTEDEVVHLLVHICTHPAITYVDYEAMNQKHAIQQIHDACVLNKKTLILSYHNFVETPPTEELRKRAQFAADNGAHMIKIAVMPKNRQDVFRLLEVTYELHDSLQLPIITMSMGELGKISRVIGWVYGSMVTFALGVEASAPGQIAVKPLRKAIESTKEITAW